MVVETTSVHTSCFIFLCKKRRISGDFELSVHHWPYNTVINLSAIFWKGQMLVEDFQASKFCE